MTVEFKIPYFENFLKFKGKIIKEAGIKPVPLAHHLQTYMN